jgi:hypothetical protein
MVKEVLNRKGLRSGLTYVQLQSGWHFSLKDLLGGIDTLAHDGVRWDGS